MFHYYKPSEIPQSAPDTYVATVRKGWDTTKGLLGEVNTRLLFPGYSGKNFDAFWDSVRDLDGIGERRIILAHQDVPALGDDDLLVYIGLLRDSVLFWRRHAAEHIFEVWFPAADRARVAELLRQASEPYESD